MESRFISLYSINSLTLVDPVQTQEKGIPTKNVLSFWEFELVKPFLFSKIFPRKHKNSLKSHVSFCLEMQRSGHFNIFCHTFTGQINKEGEELQVFDFFFPWEATSKITETWLKKGTHHTQVRVGYFSDANTVSLGSSLWPRCQPAHCHCPWHQAPQPHL